MIFLYTEKVVVPFCSNIKGCKAVCRAIPGQAEQLQQNAGTSICWDQPYFHRSKFFTYRWRLVCFTLYKKYPHLLPAVLCSPDLIKCKYCTFIFHCRLDTLAMMYCSSSQLNTPPIYLFSSPDLTKGTTLGF